MTRARNHRGWLLAATLAVLGSGCGGRSEARQAKSAAEQAVPVRVLHPERRSLRETIALTTTVDADVAVDIYAKTTARCTELHVAVGDEVAAGTLLVSLDADEARLNERQAFIRLTKARQGFERATSMGQRALVSAEVLQESRLGMEEAEAGWALAKLLLDETQVVAPVAGTVVQREVSIGDLVTPALALLRLVDFRTLEAVVHVAEYALPRIHLGLPALVTADALPGREIATAVTEVSPIIDPASGTVEVTLGLPADSGLRPGMFVRVALITKERPDTVVIPAEALLTEAGGYAVYVVRQDHAARVPVTVGLREEGWVEILSELTMADAVVTEGLFRLEPNTRVRVVDAPAG